MFKRKGILICFTTAPTLELRRKRKGRKGRHKEAGSVDLTLYVLPQRARRRRREKGFLYVLPLLLRWSFGVSVKGAKEGPKKAQRKGILICFTTRGAKEDTKKAQRKGILIWFFTTAPTLELAPSLCAYAEALA